MKTLRDFFTGTARKEERAKTVAQNNGDKFVARSQNQYQCPMKCEDEKTYSSPGNCPVCNMKLVPVDSAVSTDHNHGHSGHRHHGCC